MKRVTISPQEMRSNADHPEVIRAEEFLRKLEELFEEYNVEFEDSRLTMSIAPKKYGFGYCGLLCINNGVWMFSKPWGG